MDQLVRHAAIAMAGGVSHDVLVSLVGHVVVTLWLSSGVSHIDRVLIAVVAVMDVQQGGHLVVVHHLSIHVPVVVTVKMVVLFSAVGVVVMH